MTKNINRWIIILVFLVALVVSTLAINSTNKKLDQVNERLIGLETKVQSLSVMSKTYQTTTTKSFDEMAKQLDEQDRFISELEMLLNNR